MQTVLVSRAALMTILVVIIGSGAVEFRRLIFGGGFATGERTGWTSVVP